MPRRRWQRSWFAPIIGYTLQVAPGNVGSLRAALSAGYRPFAAEVLGEVLLDVLLVLPRQDHFGDAVTARRQNLLLDSTDREHTA